MPVRDLPDYTREMVIKYTGGFVGLEELAVRLKSIVPWDLKGNVVLMEDFSTELTEWEDTSSGLGYSATRTSRHKASGGWAVKLNCPSAGGSYAQLSRKLYYPGLAKYALLGILGWDEDCEELYLTITILSGSTQYKIGAMYSLTNQVLKVYDDTGAYVTVASSLSLSNAGVVWYPLLVTFDLETGLYDKIFLAGVEYDISDKYVMVDSSSSDPLCTIAATAAPVGGSAWAAYVDSIILAKNVP
jgi:hypothetical protein